jgi:hypothetical protein
MFSEVFWHIYKVPLVMKRMLLLNTAEMASPPKRDFDRRSSASSPQKLAIYFQTYFHTLHDFVLCCLIVSQSAKTVPRIPETKPWHPSHQKD